MNGFIYKSFDYEQDGLELVQALRGEPYLFFLDSSLNNQEFGRYSLIGFDPFEIFEERLSGFSLGQEKGLEALKKTFAPYRQNKGSQFLPFHGGLVGHLSYDYGLAQEGIIRNSSCDLKIPDIFFGFYDVVIVIDHYAKKLFISSTGLPEKNSSLREKRAQDRLKQILKKISLARTGLNQDFFSESGNGGETLNLKSNMTKEHYLEMVQKALEYIRRGDIYQVNLSQRFEIDRPAHFKDSFKIYEALRKISPSSFGCYFEGRDYQVLSSSPERFLHLEDNLLQTKPMKGTERRSQDVIEDRLLKNKLAFSGKDKAELLMITDLERNDLGKVCEYGSVCVKKLRTLEEYATVFQATSTIEGRLREEKNCFDALAACFPGGSITGAPKIRAMQIIEELEPTARGLYTGAFGYIDFGGDMDFNILIRTLLALQNKIYFQAGGGIVVDSIPQQEYNETLLKKEAMHTCLKQIFLKSHLMPTNVA